MGCREPGAVLTAARDNPIMRCSRHPNLRVSNSVDAKEDTMSRPSDSARLRTWRQLAVAGLVTAGLLASAHGAVRAQPSGIGAKTYTLGVSVVRSGELGPLGETIVQGAELAVLQRNRT